MPPRRRTTKSSRTGCVNGHQEHHPEGSYYIHYLRNGKQSWEKVGKKPAEAVSAAEFQEGYFRAINLGVPVQQEKEQPPLMISDTLGGYLEEYRLSRAIPAK